MAEPRNPGFPAKYRDCDTSVWIKATTSTQVPLLIQDSSGNDIFKVDGAGVVTSAAYETPTLQTASVDISAAELNALRATAKELVAAPGAGLVIEFVSIVLLLDYGTVGFTESADNIAVKYDNKTGVQVSEDIEATGFIDQTADTMTTGRAKLNVIAAKTACENKALCLHNTGDGEWGGSGDSVIRAKVMYRVHTTAW
jgi:hypothetical protein